MTLPALVAISLIGIVFAFQVGLAAGAPWGLAAWGGSHAGTLPRRLRIASASSTLILGFFAWIVLARDGAVGTRLSNDVLGALAWIVVGYFVLGTLVNLISRSPRERWWAPVSLAIAVCVGLLAVS